MVLNSKIGSLRSGSSANGSSFLAVDELELLELELGLLELELELLLEAELLLELEDELELELLLVDAAVEVVDVELSSSFLGTFTSLILSIFANASLSGVLPLKSFLPASIFALTVAM